MLVSVLTAEVWARGALGDVDGRTSRTKSTVCGMDRLWRVKISLAADMDTNDLDGVCIAFIPPRTISLLRGLVFFVSFLGWTLFLIQPCWFR